MDCDQNLTEDADLSSSLKLVQESVLVHDQNALADNNQTIPFDTSHTSPWDKLICPHCLKKFERRYQLKKHMGRVHKLTVPGHPFACVYCDATFLIEKLLQTHYEVKHQKEANTSVVNESKTPAVPQSDKCRIKCIECNLKFPSLKTLRKHLRIVHKLNATEEKISFPNINAFKKWKLDIERRESTYFFNTRGPFKGSNYLQRMYVCHRSGPQQASDLEGKRSMKNLIGPRKTGISCTAAMKVNIYQNEVQVEYCLQHYGHGREITFVQLTAEEQAAVLENVSNGIPLQEQLDDMKHAKSLAEHFKAWIIKKRDSGFINRAYASEIYNAGMSAIEYVEQWVRICSEMEDSPVLLYSQEALGTKSEDFMLIVMTEFQKHILMASTKQVVCLDAFYQIKNGRLYFTVLIVMDEQDNAFPVAFCLSKKMDKSTVLKFLSSIKESTGPLSCSYFMSNDDKIFYEAWQEIMQDESTWVWSIWSFEDNVRKYMNSLLKDIPTKDAVYRVLRSIMECSSQPVFATMLKNFKKSLLDNKTSEHFGKSFELHFGSNAEMWACCYRKDLKLSTIIYLEFLHKTLKYCFKMSTKKQLDKFLMTLMKFLRYKMLDRLSNMLDEEKIDLVKTTISAYHNMGLEIECESIISLSDQIWLIQSENEADAYVTREYESCPELCDLRCPDCDVCVHMYSCSCIQSLIHANMCQHIHAVVWKFLTPHFSPPASPVQDTFNDTYDIPDDAEIIPDEGADLLENVLKRMQDVYKQLRINKCKLNRNSLSEVMKMLNKCYQICSDDEIPSHLPSKSTQTESICVVPSNRVFNSLSNVMSNSTSENSAFIPVTPPIFNTMSNSAAENHENSAVIHMTRTIFNTVNKFASEKNENIAFLPVVSNDASENGKKISLIPIVPSNSVSKHKHSSKRICVEKTTNPSISLLKNSSNTSFTPVINSPVITKTIVSSSSRPSHIFANTQVNPASQTSSVTESSPVVVSPSCSDTYAVTTSFLQVPCENLSNSQAVVDPLSSERPYVIKCNAPIIRTTKHRVKTSSRTKNISVKERTNSQKFSTIKTPLPPTLTPNSQSEGPQFFWDSASKRYFVMKDNAPLTPKSNHSSEILLKPSSDSPSVSSSDQHSEVCPMLVESSVSHSPVLVEASIASAPSPNHLPSSVSHNPIVVKASIEPESSPSHLPSSVSHNPIVVKASIEPESSPSHLPSSVSHNPTLVKDSIESASSPSHLPSSVSHNPIVVKASIESESSPSHLFSSVPHNPTLVKASIESASSPNHLPSSVSHNPIVVKASIEPESSPSHLPSSVSHNPTLVKDSIESASSPSHLPSSVSHNPIVVKASIEPESSPSHLPSSVSHNPTLVKDSIESASSPNHLPSSVSHNPVIVKTSIASASSPNHLPSSVSHNPIIVKTSIASASSPNHRPSVSSDLTSVNMINVSDYNEVGDIL